MIIHHYIEGWKCQIAIQEYSKTSQAYKIIKLHQSLPLKPTFMLLYLEETPWPTMLAHGGQESFEVQCVISSELLLSSLSWMLGFFSQGVAVYFICPYCLAGFGLKWSYVLRFRCLLIGFCQKTRHVMSCVSMYADDLLSSVSWG